MMKKTIPLVVMIFYTTVFAWGSNADLEGWYVYTFDNDQNIEIIDCDSSIPDTTILEQMGWGHSTISKGHCSKWTTRRWADLTTLTRIRHSFEFDNLRMHITYSHKTKWFGAQKFDMQYRVSFTSFPDYEGDIKRDMAILTNWFETNWIGYLQWEKKVRPNNRQQRTKVDDIQQWVNSVIGWIKAVFAILALAIFFIVHLFRELLSMI